MPGGLQWADLCSCAQAYSYRSSSTYGGSLTLDGRQIDRPGHDRAMVFQQPSLLPWRTVTGNVMYGVELIRIPTEEARSRAKRFVDLVGLDTRLHILEYLHKTMGEKYRPSPLLVQYVKAGRLGKKSGRGVYEYGTEPKAM